MRQFGGFQTTTILPMEPGFERKDGQGRSQVDWVDEHRSYITLWNERLRFIVIITPPEGNGNTQLREYLRWYRSWASVHIISPSVQAPETYYPRAPGDRLMTQYYVDSSSIAESFAEGSDQVLEDLQAGMGEIRELSRALSQRLYIDPNSLDESRRRNYATRRGQSEAHSHRDMDPPRRSTAHTGTEAYASGSTAYEPRRHSTFTGHEDYRVPSSFAGEGPSTSHQWQPYSQEQPSTSQQWIPGFTPYASSSQQWEPEVQGHPPSTTHDSYIPHWMSPLNIPADPIEQDILLQLTGPPMTEPTEQVEDVTLQQEQHIEKRTRRAKAPDRFTPGSDAIRPRRKKF